MFLQRVNVGLRLNELEQPRVFETRCTLSLRCCGGLWLSAVKISVRVNYHCAIVTLTSSLRCEKSGCLLETEFEKKKTTSNTLFLLQPCRLWPQICVKLLLAFFSIVSTTTSRNVEKRLIFSDVINFRQNFVIITSFPMAIRRDLGVQGW
jgi:hypothetical protein